MRSIPARLWALMLLSALLQALPFPLAGPVPGYRRMICWVCLVPLLHCLTQGRKPLSVKQGGILGYSCGVLWYLLNCYWIYATMHRYGGLPTVAAAGVLLLFALYLGLYHALFGVLVVYLRRTFASPAALLVSPFLWTAIELLRARVTGFPWDLLGYTQIDNLWLNRLAAVTGVLGLSLLVAGVNALWLLRGRKKTGWTSWSGPALAALLTVAIPLLGLTYRAAASAGDKTAVLLQDNLSVGEDRDAAAESKQALLESFTQWSLHPLAPAATGVGDGPALRATLVRPPDIIAWAEAPANFLSGDPEFRKGAGELARLASAPLVADTASVDAPALPADRPKEFGSAAFFRADGAYVGRYDKMHLVPFGEYVPYKPLFFFAGHLLDGLDFSPGTERRLFATGGKKFGVFICYESIFGDEVREFAQKGANIFVNLSDDGWYGDTSAPWEHLDMARMRAVENGRWVLRATNTGVTGSIDPEGRLVAALPRHIRAALAVPFSYREEQTFYTRHGDWVGWLCLILCVGLAILGALKPGLTRAEPSAAQG